ncbi:MAG: DoxX family protein [Luteolibacter sp.]|uniref:DoxX family protein n=1 Tax=Luteolibacter sp. TaxID=1962973 RepID=UPI003267C134
MKKFFFDCGTRDATASLGFLALRVMVGLMMLIGHGIPKIKNYQVNKSLFPVPDFLPFSLLDHRMSLNLCIAAEVGAALMVILGFATRPAAFILAFTMVVAAFSYLGAAPWFQSSPTLVETKELAVLYVIPMIAIILAGAGGYSLDAALCKDSKRRRW